MATATQYYSTVSRATGVCSAALNRKNAIRTCFIRITKYSKLSNGTESCRLAVPMHWKSVRHLAISKGVKKGYSPYKQYCSVRRDPLQRFQ